MASTATMAPGIFRGHPAKAVWRSARCAASAIHVAISEVAVAAMDTAANERQPSAKRPNGCIAKVAIATTGTAANERQPSTRWPDSCVTLSLRMSSIATTSAATDRRQPIHAEWHHTGSCRPCSMMAGTATTSAAAYRRPIHAGRHRTGISVACTRSSISSRAAWSPTAKTLSLKPTIGR